MTTGGFSLWLIAFEVAQRLQAQGQKVALLALFDTHAHPKYYLIPIILAGQNFLVFRRRQL